MRKTKHSSSLKTVTKHRIKQVVENKTVFQTTFKKNVLPAPECGVWSGGAGWTC